MSSDRVHSCALKAAAFLAVAQLAPSTVHAASFVWPDTVAPCNGTLQACIDGVASSSIVFIAADNVTNTGPAGDDIEISRSISLAAANGFNPVFPVGIGIESFPSSAIEMGVSGITLRDAGVRLFPSAGGNYTIQRMRLLDNVGGNGIDFTPFGAGALYLRVHDNEYVRRGGAGNFLSAESRYSVLSGEISFNRVSIPDTGSSAYGLLVLASNTGSFDMTIANNEVRSGFAFGSICAVSSAPTGTPTASSVRIHGNVLVPLRRGGGTAVCVFGGEGAIEARVTHNTIVGFGTAISMVTRPFEPPASVQPISGLVVGNLLTQNNVAFRRDGIAALPGDAVSNGQNLFFDNTTDFGGTSPAVAGSGTVNTDPLIQSLQYPHLRAGSPAIGRGNGFAMPAGFPLLDADGTRRFKDVSGGGGNLVDIGAYEFGDDWLGPRGDVTNTNNNVLSLTHPALNGTQGARLLVTPNYTRGTGVAHNVPFGVFYDTASLVWAIFNQNTATDMPLGAGYSGMIPARGTGLFVHQLASTGPTLSETILDSSAVNDLADQIVTVTSNWNPSTAVGVYNPHNVSVAYAVDNRWRIRNSDGAPFLNSAAFNVYAQPPSISAFRHVSTPDNSIVNSTAIDNPRLNGFRCAELMVTPMASFGNRQFDVFYNSAEGRWSIFSGTGIPEGAEFNVMFSPRQVAECGRALFADSFEN